MRDMRDAESYSNVPLEAGRPYLNIDDAASSDYKKLLVDAAAAVEPGYDATKISGNIAVQYINSVIAATKAPLPPIDEAAQMALERVSRNGHRAAAQAGVVTHFHGGVKAVAVHVDNFARCRRHGGRHGGCGGMCHDGLG